MIHRFLLAALCLAALSTPLFAQAEWRSTPTVPRQVESRAKLELNVQSGYSLGSFIRTWDGDITLQGSVWYGGSIDYLFKRDVAFEVSYSYRSGTMLYQPWTNNGWTPGQVYDLGNVSTHFIQLGSLKSFRKDNVAPFIGGNLGMVIYSPEDPFYNTNIFFALSGVGGAKIYLTDKVGLRLQGRLYLPIYFANLTIFCGGGGCGTGVGGSGTIEGEVSGGLFFAF
ncbi:MAG: hypothetical protein EHM43_00825 [Ignavibacteriae bacterium]|nr:MAG: hypothetical protein EHM43_00825 [Ignavibacteriota bacterium]